MDEDPKGLRAERKSPVGNADALRGTDSSLTAAGTPSGVPAGFLCPHCGAGIRAHAEPIFDHDARDVIVNGSRRHLSPVAWAVLSYLRVHHRRSVPVKELESEVWGRPVASSAISVRVREVRDALSRSSLQIMVRQRIGYRLVRVGA
jgi:hypothetical protein